MGFVLTQVETANPPCSDYTPKVGVVNLVRFLDGITVRFQRPMSVANNPFSVLGGEDQRIGFRIDLHDRRILVDRALVTLATSDGARPPLNVDGAGATDQQNQQKNEFFHS